MKVNINKIRPETVFLYSCILLLFSSCAIDPQAWQSPEPRPFETGFNLNNKLLNIEKSDLLGYAGAEEFVSDKQGNIYTGVHAGPNDFSSGAILKIDKKGRVEEYLKTDAWVTGMAFDKDEHLLAMMNGVGLVRIIGNTIDTLVSKTPSGQPILMGTGLKIASDGKVYFANLSSTQQSSPKYFNKLILEMKKTGGVYCYDPNSKSVETISEGNYFANGLELSPEEDYLLLSETSKYRILRYWLKGEKKGTSEVFMDNLPGFPNNIQRNERGNYWLGFTTKRNKQLDGVHNKPGMKKLIYNLPAFLQPAPEKFGMVLEFNSNAQIIRGLFDMEGQEVSEAGAIYEHDGYLYLGGDIVSYASKYKL